MFTTCPECHTRFRLSPTQLEARRGLVRCGYCRAVFNAYDTLLPEFDSPTPDQPAEPAAPSGEPATSGPESPEPVLAEVAAPAQAVAGGEYAEPARPDDRDEDDDEPDQGAYVLRLSKRDALAMPEFEPPPAMPFANPSDAILLSDLPTRASAEPTESSGRGWLAGLVNLVLVLALLAQLAWFLPGPLAVWLPELRPGLEQACKTLGCAIPVAHDPAAIRVESSSLETDPEQSNKATLRVSFSNRSSTRQQWPHFILHLTDWKGGSLARRAFRPADYLAKGKGEGSGIAPMSEHEFSLELNLGGLSASGYEVLPKYP
jgi:predicted Zn finger-like uncharacterized protein